MKSDFKETQSWLDFMQTIKPDITEEEATYILWNETCFPFDDETAMQQIKDFLTKN